MALSGSFHYYPNEPTSQFGLYCEWTGTQSKTGNYTDVTLKVYASYKTLSISQRSGYVNINGTQESFTSAPFDVPTASTWSKRLLKTKTVRVYHNSNGTKSNVLLKASWDCQCHYSGEWIENVTAQTTVTLDTIDRTAPTVTCSVSNITADSLDISASASVTSDIWEYSTDNGTNWTQFSTTAGTTASTSVTGLTPNTTYQVVVRARKKSNHVYGSSTAAEITTLGGSVLVSVNNTAIDVALPSIRFAVTVYNSTYYHKLTVKNGSTEVLSVNLGTYTAGTNQSKTYSLLVSQRTALLNQIPNDVSFTATIELTTFTDSGYTSQIGTASTKTALMYTTAATSKPTFTAFTYSDSRTITANATGNNQVLIKGYSLLSIAATAGTAKNGASIASYSVEIGDVSKSFTSTTMSVGAVDTSGTLSLKVTCIDSRGYSTSVTKNVKVLDYTKPNVSSYLLRRKNEIEDVIQLSFSGSFCEIKADGSTDTNGLLYAGYYYKQTDEENWSSFISFKNDVTVSGNNFSFLTEQLMVDANTALSLDPDRSWDMHIFIRDKLDNLTSFDLYLVITQGTPVIALRKRNSTYDFPRVGINQPEPTAALDVGGDIKMNGVRILGYVGVLSSTDDLNDFDEQGFFSATGTSSPTTAKHYPVATAGYLEVFSATNGEAMQRYTPHTCDAIYLRYKTRGAWNAWKSAAFV